MLNSRFGYGMKKNSFMGLNIDCIQYSNIIRIIHYSYSYSGTILNPNIIRIRIWPNIFARILFVLYSLILKKQILFVFVFGQNSDAEYSYSYSVKKPVFAHLCYFRAPKHLKASLTFCTSLPNRHHCCKNTSEVVGPGLAVCDIFVHTLEVGVTKLPQYPHCPPAMPTEGDHTY